MIDVGESKFIEKMIGESLEYKYSCFWFSTLVSKQSNLKSIHAALKSAKAFETNAISMKQDNKISRLVVWTLLNEERRKNWIQARWKPSDL